MLWTSPIAASTAARSPDCAAETRFAVADWIADTLFMKSVRLSQIAGSAREPGPAEPSGKVFARAIAIRLNAMKNTAMTQYFFKSINVDVVWGMVMLIRGGGGGVVITGCRCDSSLKQFWNS